MLPATNQRVFLNTCTRDNERILREGKANVARYSGAGEEEISRRLAELDREWDVERMLETMSSSASLFGLVMGIFGRRRWLLLPMAVQGFFLQHSLQGWCPPLALLRRLGVRTSAEIDQERYALKAMRGDFHDVSAEPANDESSDERERVAFRAASPWSRIDEGEPRRQRDAADSRRRS